MSIDENIAQLIVGLAAQGLKPFSELSLPEARATVNGLTGMQLPPEEVSRVESHTYRGGTEELEIRAYIPQGEGPFPVIVYLHGGGWIAGGLDVAEESCRAIANASGAIVAAASYRLAPEYAFPAQSEDAYASLKWVFENAATFGGDPQRIILLGDSAGGNLAISAALRARDLGGPDLRGLALVHPVIDPLADFPSNSEFADGYLITAQDLNYYWSCYLQAEDDYTDPYAVPSKADSLRGLPPTLVLTMESEVSRDEAEAFASSLKAAGVVTTQKRFDGLIHGVLWMSAVVPRSREIIDDISSFVKKNT